MSKRIGFQDLSKSYVCEKLSGGFLDHLKKAIDTLNEGIYKKDSEQHDMLANSETPKPLEETVGVKLMTTANSVP